MKKYIVFFIFFCQIMYGQNLKEIYYPKELDIKNGSLIDFLVELSKNSDLTFSGTKEIKDEKIDVYFKEYTSYEDIIDTLKETYHLKVSQKGNRIVFSGKNKRENNILRGRVINSRNKKGIGKVRVIVGDNATETNDNGEYFLENMDIGGYLGVVHKEGFLKDGDFLEIKKGINKKDFFLEKDLEKKKMTFSEEETIKNNGNNVIITHISLKNISLEDSSKILKETYGEELIISKIANTGGLILKGNIDVVKSAKDILEKIDLPNEQILVEALILDVRDNIFEELGFKWNYSDGNNTLKNDLNIGILSEEVIEGLGASYGSSINLIRKFNSGAEVLNFGINLLKGTQDLKIEASPKLLLLNGKEGEFKMVEEVIVGEIQREDNETGRLFSTPLFKEAGIIFRVKPEIRDINNIYLKISLEVSDFKFKIKGKDEEDEGGTFNNKGGSKTSRSVTTHIKIKNNETIIIGGLKRLLEGKLQDRVPYLSDIPYLGKIFINTKNKQEKTDLYIKLKVNIL